MNEVVKTLGDRFHAHIDAGRYADAMDYLHKVEAIGPCTEPRPADASESSPHTK